MEYFCSEFAMRLLQIPWLFCYELLRKFFRSYFAMKSLAISTSDFSTKIFRNNSVISGCSYEFFMRLFNSFLIVNVCHVSVTYPVFCGKAYGDNILEVRG